jgi:hypothetical protein
MHSPFRRGRLLNKHDEAGTPVAVLLSECLANREFPGQDPIGKRVRLGPDAELRLLTVSRKSVSVRQIRTGPIVRRVYKA